MEWTTQISIGLHECQNEGVVLVEGPPPLLHVGGALGLPDMPEKTPAGVVYSLCVLARSAFCIRGANKTHVRLSIPKIFLPSTGSLNS